MLKNLHLFNKVLREFLNQVNQENQRWQETLESLQDIRMSRVVDSDKVHA